MTEPNWNRVAVVMRWIALGISLILFGVIFANIVIAIVPLPD